MIQCLIIDDEPSSQDVLKTFIGRIAYLNLSGVCNDAIEGLDFLKSNAVDLLFLDINMPGLSGLNFYKSLQNPPKVIFTTAYSEHALEGFELNAVDYLLKPFSFERFIKAVSKIKPAEESQSETLVLKADKRLHQIKINEISFVESLGDYVKVHVQEDTLVTYTTLKKLKEQLPNSQFIQVHKSYIINTSAIDYVEGNTIVIQSNKIPLGQKFKPSFLAQFNT